MSYEKHDWVPYDETLSEEENIKRGAVVTAPKLNEMETGIAKSATEDGLKSLSANLFSGNLMRGYPIDEKFDANMTGAYFIDINYGSPLNQIDVRPGTSYVITFDYAIISSTAAESELRATVTYCDASGLALADGPSVAMTDRAIVFTTPKVGGGWGSNWKRMTFRLFRRGTVHTTVAKYWNLMAYTTGSDKVGNLDIAPTMSLGDLAKPWHTYNGYMNQKYSGADLLAKGSHDWRYAAGLTNLPPGTVNYGFYKKEFVTTSWGRVTYKPATAENEYVNTLADNVWLGWNMVTNVKNVEYRVAEKRGFRNGIVTSLQLEGATDLNGLQESGTFMNALWINAPIEVTSGQSQNSQWGFVDVDVHNTSYITQKFTSFTSQMLRENGVYWTRSRQNGTWHTWVRHQGNNGNLKTYAKKADELSNTYPLGVTSMFVDRTTTAFPNYGTVLTVRGHNDNLAIAAGTLQMYTPYSSVFGGERLQWRSSIYDGTNPTLWSKWRELANYEATTPVTASTNVRGIAFSQDWTYTDSMLEGPPGVTRGYYKVVVVSSTYKKIFVADLDTNNTYITTRRSSGWIAWSELGTSLETRRGDLEQRVADLEAAIVALGGTV